MLKQRVITALILAPLVIFAVLKLPVEAFAGILAVVLLLGAWEWSQLVGLKTALQKSAYMLLVAALMAALYLKRMDSETVTSILTVAMIWWSLALLAVIAFPRASHIWAHSATARASAGILVLVPTWSGLLAVHSAPGSEFIILLLLLIWGADSGAYFAGKAFGRHKLAPKVSPGKSWEGVFGALVVTMLIAFGGHYWLEPSLSLLLFLVFAAGVLAISILGDLLESMFKRIVGVKDSGGILPGHGGILDRIDSLTAAAPLYAIVLLMAGGAA